MWIQSSRILPLRNSRSIIWRNSHIEFEGIFGISPRKELLKHLFALMIQQMEYTTLQGLMLYYHEAIVHTSRELLELLVKK